MFLLNEILVFSPGRRQEGFDRLSYIHGLMAPSPGFRQAIVARYLGDPQTHTVLRYWDSAEAFQEFRAGPNGNYGRNRPEGLYTNHPVIPQWQSFAECENPPDDGSLLIKVERPVSAAQWAAYQAYAQATLTLTEKAHGLTSVVAFKAVDQEAGISVTRMRSRADLEAFVDNPEYAATRSMLPADIPHASFGVFEVVSVVKPVR